MRLRNPTLPMLAALAALAFVACGRSVGARPTPVTRALAAGETIGRVERASSGTPALAGRTLLSVECKNGQLTVRTNVDAIVASDSCATPIPQSALDGLLGLPVVVTYTGDHLVMESAAGGIKLTLPATNAKLGAIDGSP